MRLLRETILLGIPSFVIVVNNPLAIAQTSATETAPPRVRLQHTTHPLAAPANAVGRVESGRKLERLLLLLTPRAGTEESLKQLLEDQQNRESPKYHQWLTAAEFGAQFGAADGDVKKVCELLEEAGFTVGPVAASKLWLEFSGTVQQVETAFQTEMQYFEVRGKRYLGNATDLTVPAAIAGITLGVVSLNNFGRRPPMHEPLNSNLTASAPTSTYSRAPWDFATIYNTKALLTSGVDGTGVSIAVTAQSEIELTDVQKFRQTLQLKTNDPNILLNGPDPGVAGPLDAAEALLDVEWAGAVAPGATIDLVVAGSTDTTSGVDLAAAYAVDNEVAPILTYTYGSCEPMLGATGNAFYNALWQQAVAEGITVLVATGDSGAAGCDNPNAGMPAAWGVAVNGVASTPYNVAVGGTEFVVGANPTTFWNGTNAGGYLSGAG